MSNSFDLHWAHDVQEVYENLGSLPGSRAWSSPSAQHLFEWVKEDEKNKMKFISDLTGKAAAILAKNDLSNTADEVLVIDAKTIVDLKQALLVAVRASQKDRKPGPESAELEATLEDILG